MPLGGGGARRARAGAGRRHRAPSRPRRRDAVPGACGISGPSPAGGLPKFGPYESVPGQVTIAAAAAEASVGAQSGMPAAGIGALPQAPTVRVAGHGASVGDDHWQGRQGPAPATLQPLIPLSRPCDAAIA
jgi:hypothetical protein